MISIEIEQKKVEEPTLERMGGFMGWPGGREGTPSHLCWVKSVSYYFKVILSNIIESIKLASVRSPPLLNPLDTPLERPLLAHFLGGF